METNTSFLVVPSLEASVGVGTRRPLETRRATARTNTFLRASRLSPSPSGGMPRPARSQSSQRRTSFSLLDTLFRLFFTISLFLASFTRFTVFSLVYALSLVAWQMTGLSLDRRRFRPTLKRIVLLVSLLSNILHVIVAILEAVNQAPPAFDWLHTLNMFPTGALTVWDRVFYLAPDVLVFLTCLCIRNEQATPIRSISVVPTARQLIKEKSKRRVLLFGLQTVSLALMIMAIPTYWTCPLLIWIGFTFLTDQLDFLQVFVFAYVFVYHFIWSILQWKCIALNYSNGFPKLVLSEFSSNLSSPWLAYLSSAIYIHSFIWSYLKELEIRGHSTLVFIYFQDVRKQILLWILSRAWWQRLCPLSSRVKQFLLGSIWLCYAWLYPSFIVLILFLLGLIVLLLDTLPKRYLIVIHQLLVLQWIIALWSVPIGFVARQVDDRDYYKILLPVWWSSLVQYAMIWLGFLILSWNEVSANRTRTWNSRPSTMATPSPSMRSVVNVDTAPNRIYTFLSQYYSTLRQYFQSVFYFGIQYFYVITLLIVYACALQKVTLINAVFMQFFLWFLLLPHLAKKLWSWLIVYTAVVWCVLYVWGLLKVDENDWTKVIGLERSTVDPSSYNSTGSVILFQAVILFMTVFQRETYKWVEENQEVSNENSNTENIVIVTDSNVDSNIMNENNPTWFHLIQSAFPLSILFVCYLALLLVAFINDRVSLIDIGYLFYFMLCCHAHFLHEPRVIQYTWWALMLYSCCVAITCYVYQFEGMRQLLNPWLSVETQQDIGWRVLVTGTESTFSLLFLYLLKHVLLLIICVYQFKLFWKRNLNQDKTYFIGLMKKKFSFLLAYFDHFTMIYYYTLSFIMLYQALQDNVSLLGWIQYGLAMSRFLVRGKKWIPSLVFSLYCLILMSHFVFQLNMIQYLWKETSAPNYNFSFGWRVIPLDNLSYPATSFQGLIYVVILLFLEHFLGHGKDWITQRFLSKLFPFLASLLVACQLMVALERHDLFSVVYLIVIPLFWWFKRGSVFSWFLFIYTCFIALVGWFQYVLLLQAIMPRKWEVLLGVDRLNGNTFAFLYESILLFLLSLLRPCSVVTVSTIALPRLVFHYFYWIPMILAFIGGTMNTNFLSFLFLFASLYFLYVGDGLLLEKRKMSQWKLLIYYTFFYFTVILAYELLYLSEILPIQSGVFIGNEDWFSLMGLERIQSDSFSQRFTLYFLFLCLLLQRNLFDHEQFRLVQEWIHSDSMNAVDRAHQYRLNVAKQVKEAIDNVTDQVVEIRKQVQFLKQGPNSGLLYQVNVDDWMKIYENHQQQQPKKAESEPDLMAPLNLNAESADKSLELNAIEMRLEEKKEALLADLTLEEQVELFEIEDNNGDNENKVNKEMKDINQNTSTNLVLKSKLLRFFDSCLIVLLKSSHDYRLLCGCPLVQELQQLASREETPLARLELWFMACSFWIQSHFVLLICLLSLLHQLQEATLLACLPIMSLFCQGLVQRPHIKKQYWELFMLYYVLLILLKYILQWIPVPLTCSSRTFSSLPSTSYDNDQNNPITVGMLLGWSVTCGANGKSQSVYVVNELLVLVAVFIQRGLMRTLGLWVDEVDEVRNEDNEENQVSMELELNPLGENIGQDESSNAALNADYNIENNENNRVNTNQVNENNANNETNQVLNFNSEDNIDESIEFNSTNLKSFFYQIYQKIVFSLYQTKFNALNTLLMAGKDYYLIMFLSDLLVFLWTIFSWDAFSGQSQQGLEFLQNVVLNNSVPPLFVALALVLFCLLIVDRVLFVAKQLWMKWCLQYLTVSAFHLWLFLLLPRQSAIPFQQSTPLQVWICIKFCYWYASAKQMKHGYPELDSGFILTRRYTLWNHYLFQVYKIIPFILEIRAIIDWSMTDTCLSLESWLKLEDLYANLFTIQCFRVLDRKYPRAFGEMQKRSCKQWTCLGLVSVMTFVLWLPLLLLSLPGVTKQNPLDSVQLTLSVNQFTPFYSMTCTPDSSLLTLDEFNALQQNFVLPSSAQLEQVQKCKFSSASPSIWTISDPSFSALIQTLNATNARATLKVQYTLMREEPVQYTTISYGVARDLNRLEKMNLSVMLTNGTNSFNVPDFVPFLHAYPTNLVTSLPLKDAAPALPLIALSYSQNQTVFALTPAPQVYLLNDPIPSFSTLSSYGIIGLYVAIVFALGRIIRSAVTGQHYRIAFDELPNVEGLLKMVESIQLARSVHDLWLEEMLWWQLINIYRSGETLMAVTRMV